MNRSQVIAIAAVAASILAGCGGGGGSGTGLGTGPGTGSATIGGNVSGIPTGVTVLLINNSSEIVAVNASGNFSFDTKVKSGGSYSVNLFTQPPGAYCTIANGSGTVDQNADAVSNVSVSCQTAPTAGLPYNVGVTVSGLAVGNSVTFVYDGADPLTANANGLAVFSQTFNGDEVPPLGSTGVTVATNPLNQTCTVTPPPASAPGNAAVDYFNYTAACH